MISRVFPPDVDPRPRPDRANVVLTRMANENPKVFAALIAFFEDPPDHGKLEIAVRHRQLHGVSETRSTY